jgi:aspartyl-tRNA(Asn)/glutamyl-tRNA(Gln) amidotransferase subunit A
VARMMEQAIEVFRKQGATLVDVDLPHTEYGIPTYYVVATAEASSNLARYDGVRYGHRTTAAEDLIDLYARSRAEGFGPEVKRRIMLGTYALSSGYYDAYYLRALKVRRLIKRDFDQAFEKCDALLCPTATGPAFKIGAKSDDPLAMYLNDVYTVNCNLAGIPGIALPAGFTENEPAGAGRRLPLGIQLFGPVFAEDRLLRIARTFEAATDFHKARPELEV